MAKLTLSLLGQPRIECDSALLVVDTRKAIALLAYIAVTQQPHNRETLATLLWPEYDHVRAYANLRRTVWALNKALAGNYLSIDRDMIGLNHKADLWIDVDRFVDLIAQTRAHSHAETDPCLACLELLSQAVELYRGDFLHGFTLADSPSFDDWQFFQAESLQRAFAQVLERLVQGYRARSDFAAAIAYARRWVALDQLHEPAQRALMRLYAWFGQRSAALRQYRECVRVLETGLGTAPQVATTQLYEAIRANQLPIPEPATRAGGRADASPLARARPLPAQPDSFVGRAEELHEIATLLADPTCRLLTLVGPGGIGKTRLALQAAAEQRDAFAHSVFFVPCAAVNSLPALIAAIADALQFSFYDAGEPKRQILDFLRPKQILLVIDNAEYLAGAVDLLTELLADAPALKMLATSVERLNLHEEWTLDVQGLRYPNHNAALADQGDYSAVQLFYQRARRSKAGFAPTDADKSYIARICRLVGGMPLGIELAASWLRILSCQEIVREVESNLDFLATSLRNVPERHRSLRAVFEHSWNLLSEQEQYILGRLAVFREGFSREAAAAVVVSSEVSVLSLEQGIAHRTVQSSELLTLLAALVDKSLLRRDAGGRYQMLGVIQQYAEEKLTMAARQAAQDLHCIYYAGFLRRHGEAIKGGHQQAALMEIRQEIENLHAGWIWAVDSGRRHEIQIFTNDLYRFYELQSRFQAGEELFKQIAERLRARLHAGRPAAALDDPLLAAIQAAQGGFCYRLGRSDQALQLLQAALAVFRAGDAAAEAAFCLTCLGDIARIKGQYHDARSLLEQSLAICSQIGDRAAAARAYTNLGIVAGASGEYRAARELFQHGLVFFQALGDQWGEAKASINLGIIAYYLHEHADAQGLLATSLAIARAIDNRYGIAVALNNLGLVACELGEYAEAERLHQESHAMFEQIGYRLGAGLTLNDLGHVARLMGEHAASRAYFYTALRTAMAIQASPLALDALVGIALLIKDTEPARARDLLDIARQHPASGKETSDRAASLLAELDAGTTTHRYATISLKQPADAFETLVVQLLDSQPA